MCEVLAIPITLFELPSSAAPYSGATASATFIYSAVTRTTIDFQRSDHRFTQTKKMWHLGCPCAATSPTFSCYTLGPHRHVPPAVPQAHLSVQIREARSRCQGLARLHHKRASGVPRQVINRCTRVVLDADADSRSPARFTCYHPLLESFTLCFDSIFRDVDGGITSTDSACNVGLLSPVTSMQ
jgi:hypothetical protein